MTVCGTRGDARPAVSRDELEQAYRLVYESYVREGYMVRQPSGMRLSAFNALPGTATFVAKMGSEVVGSLTVVPDSAMGLPMEGVYQPEVQQLRREGRQLAEATMFGARGPENDGRLSLLLLLMKRAFDYARFELRADDLCIAVHPRRSRLYQRYLLFEQFGPERAYPCVRYNPAVASRLDLLQAESTARGDRHIWGRFFDSPTPGALLRRRHRMCPADLQYFFVERSPVFAYAPREQLQCLEAHYPDCPWHAWRAGQIVTQPLVA